MASKKLDIIKGTEKILNILENDEQTKFVSTEIDAADLEIVLNPPQDGRDSDRDDANSDAEVFTTMLETLGRVFISNS